MTKKRTRTEDGEYLAALQRLQADFDNYRKRVCKEILEAETEGEIAVVSQFLPVLDDLNAAIAAMTAAAAAATDETGLCDGLGLVRNKLVAILGSLAVEIDDPKGESFDPRRHEAVGTAESSEPGIIVEVVRSGYRSGKNIVRPAQVIVGRAVVSL